MTVINLHSGAEYRRVLAGVAYPRVLITGSRTANRSHLGLIRAELVAMPPGVTIVHGGQGFVEWDGTVVGGVDKLADEVARELGMPVCVFPAKWGLYGRAAGPIRNAEMIKFGIDMCVAFWNGVSRGTLDCMTQARRAGVPVKVVDIEA